MPKFNMSVLVGTAAHQTARLAGGTAVGDQYNRTENGKFAKLVAHSRYALCVAGDPIEAKIIQADSMAQADGFKLGSIQRGDRTLATCDGLQATPGTGSIGVGDFVVCGTVVAKDTALASGVHARVTRATNQPGATVTAADNLVASVNAALALVTNANRVAMHGWRVIAFTGEGTGAVGHIAVLEKVTV